MHFLCFHLLPHFKKPYSKPLLMENLISGHSFAIDESSMTRESKIVNKDSKAQFLMSSCKVAEGYSQSTEASLVVASRSRSRRSTFFTLFNTIQPFLSSQQFFSVEKRCASWHL